MRSGIGCSEDDAMFKFILKGTPGWWILHLVAILVTLWLGAVTRFTP
jgi:hypothetical protein